MSPLEVEIEPESFKLKGRIPDKILYLILGLLCVGLGLNAQEVLDASLVFLS